MFAFCRGRLNKDVLDVTETFLGDVGRGLTDTVGNVGTRRLLGPYTVSTGLPAPSPTTGGLVMDTSARRPCRPSLPCEGMFPAPCLTPRPVLPVRRNTPILTSRIVTRLKVVVRPFLCLARLPRISFSQAPVFRRQATSGRTVTAFCYPPSVSPYAVIVSRPASVGVGELVSLAARTRVTASILFCVKIALSKIRVWVGSPPCPVTDWTGRPCQENCCGISKKHAAAGGSSSQNVD